MPPTAPPPPPPPPSAGPPPPPAPPTPKTLSQLEKYMNDAKAAIDSSSPADKPQKEFAYQKAQKAYEDAKSIMEHVRNTVSSIKDVLAKIGSAGYVKRPDDIRKREEIRDFVRQNDVGTNPAVRPELETQADKMMADVVTIQRNADDDNAARLDDERQKAQTELAGAYDDARAAYGSLKQSVDEMTKELNRADHVGKLDDFYDTLMRSKSAIDNGGKSVVEIRKELSALKDAIYNEIKDISTKTRDYISKNLDFTNVCGRNSAMAKALNNFFKRDLEEAFRDFEMEVRQNTTVLQRKATSTRNAFTTSDLGEYEDLEDLKATEKELIERIERDAKAKAKLKAREKGRPGQRRTRGGADKSDREKLEEVRKRIAKTKRIMESGKLILTSVPDTPAYDAAAEGVRQATMRYRTRVEEMLKKLKGALTCDDGSKLKAMSSVIRMSVNRLNNDARVALLSNNDIFTVLNADAVWIARTLKKKTRTDAMAQASALTSSMQMRMQKYIRAIELIHANVVASTTSSVSRLDALLSGVSGVMYGFKLAKIGTAAAAAAAAEAAFASWTKSHCTRDAVGRPPDLRYFALFFFMFDAAFTALIVAVSWFAAQLAVDDHISFVKDIALDMIVCTLVSTATIVWMADIIQDKKYFEYKMAAPRAIRVVKLLAIAVSAVHALIPYYYMMGPFYSRTLILGMYKKDKNGKPADADKSAS